MPARSVAEALAALDDISYANERQETDYSHEVVVAVAEAVSAHADYVATQAVNQAQRMSAYAAEAHDVAAGLTQTARAVQRGELDPLVAQRRWRALELRSSKLARLVDEKDSNGNYRLQEQAVVLLRRLEDPLASLDGLQRRYPSLLRHWNH